MSNKKNEDHHGSDLLFTPTWPPFCEAEARIRPSDESYSIASGSSDIPQAEYSTIIGGSYTTITCEGSRSMALGCHDVTIDAPDVIAIGCKGITIDKPGSLWVSNVEVRGGRVLAQGIRAWLRREGVLGE